MLGGDAEDRLADRSQGLVLVHGLLTLHAATTTGAVELGVYTFAELTAEVGPEERLRNLIEEIELADEVGLDVFGIGEHHRPDFAVSAPATVLAAAAVRTKRIRLTSASLE